MSLFWYISSGVNTIGGAKREQSEKERERLSFVGKQSAVVQRKGEKVMSEKNCELVINVTGKGVTKQKVESRVGAISKQIKISYLDKNQCIDDMVRKVDSVIGFLEEKHINSTKSVEATEICYSMAIFYDCLYKACEIFSQNIPTKLEYDNLKALRNDIGMKYSNAATFMDEEIRPLIINLKACDSIGYEDAIDLDTIAGLVCTNILSLIEGSHSDIIFGKDYIVELVRLATPVFSKTTNNSAVPDKDDNLIIEDIDKTEQIDSFEPDFDFEKTYAQILNKVNKAKDDLEGIALVKSMLSPDLDKAGDKRAYVEGVLNDIKDTINAKLKPLYDDAERSYKDIEQSFDKLIGKLIQLKDESLAKISVNV